MPPKKLKSREGNAQLPEPVSKFPFRVGDEVEMKSFESGYRGAWFRVQIRRIRLDRKGNIMCTMGYKDYDDESVEEILAFEWDPASEERILMVRPLPPPSVKESKFNKNVHTKLCAVYRDEWEVGDLVDWWYHHCWWAAKVISVVGDGRFQLVCPAPPGGEGGVYLANSRDLRPSLKWSCATQWTAPPSKEIGKIPCARIVWLLNSNETAGFAAPNQDKVPRKRGRPKMVRPVNTPLDRKEIVRVPPLYPDKEPEKRRPNVIRVTRPPPLHYYDAKPAVAPLSKETKVPQKRGRPRKVEVQEEAAQKRIKPIVIKIIHPRQDPGYETVDHMSNKPSLDERRLLVKDERTFDFRPENEMRQGAKPEAMMTESRPGEENQNWVRKESSVTEEENRHGTDYKPSVVPVPKQISEEKKHWVKQKRSVMRIPDKVRMARGNEASNGHSDEAKRRKIEHILRTSEPDAVLEHERSHISEDQDGKKLQKWKDDVRGKEGGENNLTDDLLMVQSKPRKKQKKHDENKVAVKDKNLSSVGDVVVEHMNDLVPRQQLALPYLDEGKESSADQTSGQLPEDGNQNGQVEAFNLNFGSNPVNGEVKTPQEDLSIGEVCKEALDLKVLKVLNAYEEAFTDNILEIQDPYLNHDPAAEEYKGAFTNNFCSVGQKSAVATKDMSVVKAFDKASTEDTRLPRRKSSLAQDPAHADGKLAKPRECPVSSSQKKLMKGTRVDSTCKGLSLQDIKSSTFQDRHMEKAGHFTDMSHSLLIGTEASDLEISVGGSEDSFPGRMAEEAMKDSGASQDGPPLIDEEDSGSSLVVSSHPNQSRKSANPCPNTFGDAGMTAEKSDKNEICLFRKRVPRPVMNHKFSLSRKLIDQARREASAKRRRSCRSTQRA